MKRKGALLGTGKMNDISETERRIQRRIAAARVKHMSNAKWRKLFAVLHSLPEPLAEVGIKFINNDNLFTGPTPGPDFDYDDHFGECGGISYAPFTDIEFVQIPITYHREVHGPRYPSTEFTNDVQSLFKRLAQVGSFPIQQYDGGIRILGYEWSGDREAELG